MKKTNYFLAALFFFFLLLVVSFMWNKNEGMRQLSVGSNRTLAQRNLRQMAAVGGGRNLSAGSRRPL